MISERNKLTVSDEITTTGTAPDSPPVEVMPDAKVPDTPPDAPTGPSGQDFAALLAEVQAMRAENAQALAVRENRNVPTIARTLPDADDLADFRDAGGVRLSEYDAADVILTAGGPVNLIALAAVGMTNGEGGDLSEGERIARAQTIDTSIRQHAAWLDSRPLIEKVRGDARPVIFVGPAE